MADQDQGPDGVKTDSPRNAPETSPSSHSSPAAPKKPGKKTTTKKASTKTTKKSTTKKKASKKTTKKSTSKKPAVKKAGSRKKASTKKQAVAQTAADQRSAIPAEQPPAPADQTASSVGEVGNRTGPGARQATGKPAREDVSSTVATAESPSKDVTTDNKPEAPESGQTPVTGLETSQLETQPGPPMAPNRPANGKQPGSSASVELRIEAEKPAQPRASRKSSDQGILMRILLIALSLAAVALYIKILLPPDFDYASLMVFDSEAPSAQHTPAASQTAVSPGILREVPESQMHLIKEAFAPELIEQ